MQTREEIINASNLPAEFKEFLISQLNSSQMIIGRASVATDDTIFYMNLLREEVQNAVQNNWDENKGLFLKENITERYLTEFFIDFFTQNHLEIDITMWGDVREGLKAEL